LTLSYGEVTLWEGPQFGLWPFCPDQMLKIILQPDDKVTIFAAQPSADGKSFSFDVLINGNCYTINVWEDTSGLVRRVRYRAHQGRLIPFTPNDFDSMNEWHPSG